MKEFISILRRFVPPYKHYLALNIFFNILASLLTLFSFATIMPILEMLFKTGNVGEYTYMAWDMSNIKDVAINNFYYITAQAIEHYGASITILFLGIFLTVTTALKTGSAYLSSFFLIPLRNGVVRDIRAHVHDKVLSLPIGFFTNERKGDIMARMTGDTAEVETSIMSSLEMIFKDPIMIIVCLTMMFLISWQLTLFVLILLPTAGLLMGRVGRSLKRKSTDLQSCWGFIMSSIEETLGGMRIIKAFNAEGKIATRFNGILNNYFNLGTRVARRQALAHPMSEFLGTATIVIVLWFGGSLILSGSSTIDAAQFIYFLVIFYSIINPVKDLSKGMYAVQRGLAAMERVDKLLSTPNPIQDPEKPAQLTALNEGIEYRNVSFKYSNDYVLRNISLNIKRGQTVALVGQSGSGKTTLADLLPRFYDVNEGGIFIDGINIKDVKVHDLRNLMGNVNQEAILFNDTFFNNIAFGVKDATLEQVMEAARIANAHNFIMETPDGYNTNIGDRGCLLSGGQRQRISIARAILKNPPILILDEATSALDTESERLVQEALEKLMRNRTTLVVAHRLSTIRNADLICVVHEGRIVEQGKHDELVAKDGYYKHLVDMQKF
ncbi:MAG: ABC transporter ATP-binding protein [Bacteroidaceae bacterium]|nr:ABC transporter ATP-binding protein [Bacteroidaceae bacterium]